MTLSRLEAILLPPADPQELGLPEQWEIVEEELGTKLPEDYKSFIDKFGTGIISHFITIFNPFSANEFINLVNRNKKDLEGLGFLINKYPKDFAHSLFPAKGGLVPFGSTDNGDIMYWKTDANPASWPIVVYESRSSENELFRESVTNFLAGLLMNTIHVRFFPSDFPGVDRSFSPFTPNKRAAG